jgi:hypothetical protein
MSLPMAYALVTFFRRVRVKAPFGIEHIAKLGFASLLVALIVVGSVSSSLISGDLAPRAFFWAGLSWEEIEALEYLHYSLPKGSKTAYLSLSTGRSHILGFANDKWAPDPYMYLGQFYSPYGVLYAIRKAGAEFLYVNRLRDSRYLERNVFVQQLIKLLPVRFNNSEVTIYSIPSLQFPSETATLRLVSVDEEKGAMYDAYVLWSLALMMSERPYMIISNVTNPTNITGAESIIVPYDPFVEREVGQLWEWVSEGGHLILSNTNPYGMFSKLAGLVFKETLANTDSTENWDTLYRPRRGEILVEPDIKVEGDASLRLKYDGSLWEEWIYTPDTPWNLSEYEYLGIWVYVNPEWVNGTGGGPRWYLDLMDSGDKKQSFRYDLSIFDPQTKTYSAKFTGWKLHLIPIREYYGTLNLTSIKELRIVTGGGLPVNMLVDDIFVVEESERSVIVADGVRGVININLPLTEVENLNPSADVKVIANYTLNGVPVAPFAIQRELGNGKVTYLNVNLLYQMVLSGSAGATYEVLLKILELVGVD